MSESSNLRGKRALVFGAGGPLGAAVGREFAAQGAEVFLSGRTKSKVQSVVKEIGAAGGHANAAEVDASDEAAVEAYIDRVVREAGPIDIMVHAIGAPAQDFGSGTQVVDLAVTQFMVPLTTIVRSQFITARAAARHMKNQGSGVIIFFTGSPARPHSEGTSAIGASFAATENLTRHLGLELGPAGIRAVCLRTSAMPDTTVIRDTLRGLMAAMGLTEEQANQRLADGTILKVSPSTAQTAKIAAFLASDHAATVTGTQVMSQIR